MKTNANPGDTVDVRIIRRADSFILKNCKVMESKWMFGRAMHTISHPDMEGELPINDDKVIHTHSQ